MFGVRILKYMFLEKKNVYSTHLPTVNNDRICITAIIS